MAGFDAGHVVDPLDYTFQPFAASEGRITEPSDQQIDQFLKDLNVLMKEISADIDPTLFTEGGDPGAMLEAIEKIDIDQISAQMAKMAELYSTLCSGKPTAEAIQALPRRIRTIFFKWITEEVISPEAGPVAGTAQVLSLPRAAGG